MSESSAGYRKVCPQCGVTFRTRKFTKIFDSVSCRQKYYYYQRKDAAR